MTYFVTRLTAQQALRDDPAKQRSAAGVERQLRWFDDTIAALHRTASAIVAIEMSERSGGLAAALSALSAVHPHSAGLDLSADVALLYGSAPTASALATVLSELQAFHETWRTAATVGDEARHRRHAAADRVLSSLDAASSVVSSEYRTMLQLPPFDHAALRDDAGWLRPAGPT